MGGVLWFIGDVNFIITVLAATATYSLALALAGGLSQRDMDVLWRAVPLGRLRARLGRARPAP
jgi:hypothetical protein